MSDHVEFPCPHCGVNLKLDINCDHEKEISRLRDALNKYGIHFLDCAIHNRRSKWPCNCGFKEALASPPKEEKL